MVPETRTDLVNHPTGYYTGRPDRNQTLNAYLRGEILLSYGIYMPRPRSTRLDRLIDVARLLAHLLAELCRKTRSIASRTSRSTGPRQPRSCDLGRRRPVPLRGPGRVGHQRRQTSPHLISAATIAHIALRRLRGVRAGTSGRLTLDGGVRWNGEQRAADEDPGGSQYAEFGVSRAAIATFVRPEETAGAPARCGCPTTS